MTTRFTLLVSSSVLLFAASASAQSFNVDIQDTTTTFGVPPSTYSAAAGASMAGTWNVKNPTNATATVLTDISGAVTTATIAKTAGSSFAFNSNDPATTGDDQALLDDIHDLAQAPVTWVIANLAAGTYTLYCYTYGPNFSTEMTSVSVNGGPTQQAGGSAFAGFVQGNTHTIHSNIVVAAGGSITIVLAPVGAGTFGNFGGLQLEKQPNPTSATPYCFGDGTGTACPCANIGATGNGCASSVNAAGGNLAATGNASIASDTFSLNGTGMPNASALYFQGTTQVAGGAGAQFGDGLRCAGGTIIRLGTKTNVAGASSYPGGSTPISVKGNNAAGDVRNYQCWYRNAATFCTNDTFNLTNALNVTWAP
jgi:hypothetical protein